MNSYKKVISITMMCAVIAFSLVGFTGCTNPFSLLFSSNDSKVSEEDIALMKGTWNLVEGKLDDKSVSANEIGSSMSIIISDSGKLTFIMDGETEEYKWEKDGDLITIFVPDSGGVSKGHTAVLDGNRFTLYWDYKGKPMQMVFAKKGTEAEKSSATNNATAQQQTSTQQQQPSGQPTAPAQQPASNEPVDLLGDWRLSGRWEGTTYKYAEQIDTNNIYYTFYESGEYSLKNYNSEDLGYFRMDFGSGTITLKSDNGGSLLGSIKGNELSIYDPNTNVTYVYKK